MKLLKEYHPPGEDEGEGEDGEGEGGLAPAASMVECLPWLVDVG